MPTVINVDIANLALGFLGEEGQIDSPDDDTKPARSVRAAWSLTREFVFSEADWSCGKRRATLTARNPSQEFPVIGFDYAFPVPEKCVRVVRILEPYQLTGEFQLQSGPGGREIFIDDLGPVTIEYIEDVEEPARWSADFKQCFAMRLAWQVADQVSGDKQRKQQALAAYERGLSSGRNSDARQQPPRQHASTEWAAARWRGGRGRAPNT